MQTIEEIRKAAQARDSVSLDEVYAWETARLDAKKYHIPYAVWHSGQWLMREVRARGGDDSLAEAICFGVGQRQAMLEHGEDPWVPAVLALGRYEQGEWDVCGKVLAEQLLREKFGDPIDRRKLAEWMLSRVGVFFEE